MIQLLIMLIITFFITLFMCIGSIVFGIYLATELTPSEFFKCFFSSDNKKECEE